MLYIASSPTSAGSDAFSKPIYGSEPMIIGLLALIIFGILACIVILFMLSRRVAWRARAGQCPKCNYDLRGEFDDGCPECGWRRDHDLTRNNHPLKQSVWFAIVIGLSALCVMTVIAPVALTTAGLVTRSPRPVQVDKLVFFIDDRTKSIRFDWYHDVADPFEHHGELTIRRSMRSADRRTVIQRHVEMTLLIYSWHDKDGALLESVEEVLSEAVGYLRQNIWHGEPSTKRDLPLIERAAHAPSEMAHEAGIIRHAAHIELPNYEFYFYVTWCFILVVLASLSGYRWLKLRRANCCTQRKTGTG